MKKIIILLTLALTVSISGIAQQNAGIINTLTPNLRYGLQIAPRGGYDLLLMYPKVENETVKFYGGVMGGLSVDYYWDWIGAGIDGDYIRNRQEMDIENSIFKSNITRIFYGAGPSFRYVAPTNNFSAELNLRGGMASISQGKFTDSNGSESSTAYPIIFESKVNVFSAKSQLRFTYFTNPWLGFHAGAYYLHHFNVPMDIIYFDPGSEALVGTDKNIASTGVFAGVSFRLTPFGAGTTRIPKPIKEDRKAEDNLINGKVIICNSKTPIEGVTVTVREKNGSEKILTSNRSGEFSFYVTPNTEVTVHGKKSNYFSQVVTLSAADLKRYKNVILEICMERVDCNESVRLENIHYDLDKYDIRPDARPELDRLVQFLQDNPEVKVELSSHTDSRASHEYNQRLSQNRANSARSYVISKGINPSRVISVGYGETRLLNRCADGVNCSEQEHQLNRRTEMKVICPD